MNPAALTQTVVDPPENGSGRRSSRRGEPVWELALQYPVQGDWTERDYFAAGFEQLVELVDGELEFPAMPNLQHQALSRFLFRLLDGLVSRQKLGEAYFAPLPVQLWPGRVREPDILFVRRGRLRRVGPGLAGADLVMEIVSAGKEQRERDLVAKRADYAAAGIAEYWIVDPESATVTVLALDGEAYREHGVFKAGEMATSVLLPGLAVDVTALWAAGQAAE